VRRTILLLAQVVQPRLQVVIDAGPAPVVILAAAWRGRGSPAAAAAAAAGAGTDAGPVRAQGLGCGLEGRDRQTVCRASRLETTLFWALNVWLRCR